MALTGFNPEEVYASIGAVKTAYENLITALGDNMQTQFVGGMVDKWACNEAQKFFNDAFKPSIDGLITNANNIFESVVKSMNGAGQYWGGQTQTSYSNVPFSVITKTMDISGIQENIAGVRGIDKENTSSVTSTLVTIADSAKTALTNAQNAVQNCGYFDAGNCQRSNLIDSLGQIKTNIDNAVQDITTNTKSAIENTVARYGDTAGKIASAFAGQ